MLAAAIKSGAQVVVTANLVDFPDTALGRFALEAQHPDEFVLNLIDLAPAVVLATLEDQAAALKNPRQTIEQLLTTLEQNGLVRSVARLRELFAA